MTEKKIVIKYSSKDTLMKALKPIIDKVFEEEFNEFVLEYHRTDEDIISTVSGVNGWLELFTLKWLYAPRDIIDYYNYMLSG